jgi:putative transposase
MTGESAGRRRSLRLKGYDYTRAGAYFVTICAQDQACLFGNVVDGCMCLNDAGHMLARLWNDIPPRFADVEINTFVVMPNHVHGIIVLPDAANGWRPGSRLRWARWSLHSNRSPRFITSAV